MLVDIDRNARTNKYDEKYQGISLRSLLREDTICFLYISYFKAFLLIRMDIQDSI